MKTKAAILWERNTPWSVEEIELDAPKAGEVLVKLAASGLCHSDEHLVTGDLAGATPEPPLARETTTLRAISVNQSPTRLTAWASHNRRNERFLSTPKRVWVIC